MGRNEGHLGNPSFRQPTPPSLPPDPSSTGSLHITCIVPSRQHPFPELHVRPDIPVPGRRNFSAQQFDFERLSRGVQPVIQPPEKTPTSSEVLRPPFLHPAPLWSTVLPDPDLDSLPEATASLYRSRVRVHEVLAPVYPTLPDLDYLYLLYWVCERIDDCSCSTEATLAAAALWPGFSLHATRCGSSVQSSWLPVRFCPDPNPALLRFTGLGGSWSALDCGDHVQFGTGGSRQNACVFRATSKVLPVTDWLFCLQTLQLAAEFTQATASISLANAPASFVDMVQRTQDLTCENSPFDPMVLLALSPPCLRSCRLVFVFVPTEPHGHPTVVILSPSSSSAPPAHTGFLLLHRQHAWALTPPPFLTATFAALSTWENDLRHASVNVRSFYFHAGWPAFWMDAWPQGPAPPSPPTLPTFGGYLSGLHQNLSLNKNSGEDHKVVSFVETPKIIPTNDSDTTVARDLLFGDSRRCTEEVTRTLEVSQPMIECAEAYLEFQRQSQPMVTPEAWRNAMRLGDNLVGACHHDVASAVRVLRSRAHPGRTVGERDTNVMEAFLDLGVLPKELSDLKRDRAYNGAPSYFEELPTRHGTDCVQPSLRDHAVEAVGSIWEEFRTNKLLLVSIDYREGHLSHLPNSPLARVPKHDARGNLQATGRIIRNHSFPRGRSINDMATRPPPGEIKLPTIQHLVETYLYLRAMFPHHRILFAKCDVSGAFQWIGLHYNAVPYMGSYVEGPSGAGYLPAFSFPLRCTFGFVHSPAEWDIEAKSIGTYLSATRFQNQRRDGYWGPIGTVYVDDVMMMSIDVGLNPLQTMRATENILKGLLGPSAINLKKHALEGNWATRAIFLGFEFDSELGTISLSAEKLEKARKLLAQPIFDYGSKDITKHDVQRLQGSVAHWSLSARPLHAFKAGFTRILSSPKDELDPSWASPEPSEWAWERFWADILCMRMIVAQPELVGSPMIAPYLVTLPPVTRMRLARSDDKFRVLGTDATEWSVAAVDFETACGTRIQLPQSVPAAIRGAATKRGLKRGLTRKGESMCMAVTEMLSVLLGLLQWGDQYRGALVIVVTDNHSVLSWIRNRCARNVYAQALVRTMIRLEMLGGFEVWSEDVRSEDNHLPDALSRLKDRLGHDDSIEMEKWLHYSQARGRVFQIEEPKHLFPEAWFSTPNNRNWTMLLPGESPENYRKWNPHGEIHVTTTQTEPGLPYFGPCGSTPLSPKSKSILLSRLDEAKKVLKDKALAAQTHAKYGSAFKQWTEFRSLLDKDPYLRGEHRENAEDLMDFIAYQGVLKSLKHGTVQGYLTAIRHHHLDAGLGEVTKHPRITAIMTGLKKASGAATQKRPVTPHMLIHIQERLLRTNQIMHQYLNAGLEGPFFFMLRGSEYSAYSQTNFDGEKILRRKDVRFKCEGKYTQQFWKADEIEIHIRASKTDQIGVGAFRSMRASGETLCVVKAFQKVYALGLGMEDTAPFLMTPSGRMVTRSMISEILKSAAKDLGDPLDEYSTHSLRRGGATALYSKGYPKETIMFLGRWRSDSWLRYAKMTNGQLSAASKDLATASYTLAGGGTADSPRHPGRKKGAPDPDIGMSAWYDPDPKDPGTFVLLHVQFECQADQRVAHYVRLSVWDQEKYRLPTDPAKRVEELSKRHEVLHSDPGEVEDWIASHPVHLHMGGDK